jgi:NADPH-dependent 2,4-dienoyl-CoA reductase/sulfur reductase-like enzyme
MPYNIADPRRGIEDLIVRKADVFREKQGINLLTGHQVSRIDPAAKIVAGTNLEGKPFETAYDKLLIATGSAAVLPDIPGVDLPGVTALKNLEDGRRVKDLIRNRTVKHAVILGMGYVALEMCEALRALDIAVTAVKPNPRFMPWLHQELASAVKETLEANGVRVLAGKKVERIEAAGHGYRVVTPDGEIACDMVLVGIGVSPNSNVAAAAGLELGPHRSIAVDRMLRTSAAHIYAAGDCADAYHVVTGQKTWIPLALRANRSGWAAADNVLGRRAELEGVAGTAVFRTFDMEVARTGLTPDEAAAAGFEPLEVAIRANSRAHAHPGSSPIRVSLVGDKKSGRLLGAQMVGREGVAHRINAPAVALHAKMTVAQFAQTDLSYAPPFGPTWDPCLTAANQLLKGL